MIGNESAMNLTRKAIEEHWRASDDSDTEAEYAIYARGGHPADRQFTVLRISGDGHIWVSECIITYDGVPTYSVSIMQFARELVVHETQYFAEKFSAPTWRAALAEPIPGGHIEER
ncbi:hypothetical protein N7481_002708 [Penicillium waksmanii]|uniref:uncharacterized protein n=1 Tax=Penicillium waksmanii TaxID=69791 RepID=UPI002548849A|nr:uncharacterized protein N7481_002708 [Penicillium waksmanii]KAJ5995731.1 hypothetical protein N7481_002708 [Penicillium waksmanii]